MMLKSAACLILMMLVGMPAGANGPESVNYYTIGGPCADFGYSIEPTSDGGYIVAGISLSSGNEYGDAWLVKLSQTGEFEWERVYGGPQIEEARHAIQTSDGGYLITGKTCSYSTGDFSDLWLIKTDNQGNPQWSRTFGEDNGEELGSFVQQTSEGGYIIAGRSNSFGLGDYDIYLIKTNALGYMQWQRVLGGNGDDFGYTVRQCEAGYAIAGYTNSFGSGLEDVCLIMTNTVGQQISVDTYGGPAADYGGFLTQTIDGGYIISGESHSYGSGGSTWIVKTDADGNELWTFCYGGLYHEGSYG
ncbi:hypothetical protein KKA00_13295, partial [bacterium]|nr:hypothetical protein [bacterium]